MSVFQGNEGQYACQVDRPLIGWRKAKGRRAIYKPAPTSTRADRFTDAEIPATGIRVVDLPALHSVRLQGAARTWLERKAVEAGCALARRYAGATKGWSAVAASVNGKTAVALGADSEEAAVNSALADCAKVDRECRIIAIGPFTVEPL